MAPEVYWFVRTSLAPIEIELTHFTDSIHAEKIVLSELPKIVILNDDDKNVDIKKFIGKMRNHIFARNTMFLVFTSSIDVAHRRDLIVNGAAQVFHRTMSQNPDPKYFLNTIKWLLSLEDNISNPFDTTYTAVNSTAKLTSWGRLGSLSTKQCIIESNLDLNPGDIIPISSTFFNEFGLKDIKFKCIEKNTVGRYYQYANSFIGTIETKNKEQLNRNIEAFIANNKDLSKNKPIKILFFESDANQRQNIAQMIKLDKKYCARGYGELVHFDRILEYQLPNLVLINRKLIQKNPKEFDALKKFLKNHFCFCITYDFDQIIDLKEFSKNHAIEHVMHIDRPVDEKLLESMVQKLNDKLPITKEERIVFSKHSPYSRINFHTEVNITGVSNDGISIDSPFATSAFCSSEIESGLFLKLGINHLQFFRTIENIRPNSKSQKFTYIGLKENELNKIKNAILEINKKID